FCRDDLVELKPLVKQHPLSRQMIETCLERGWQVVVATNPIFPRAVVDARLCWGELDDLPYRLITAYENSSFCKPSPHYFTEILNLLQVAPQNCLMIGNDSQHDTSATQVGIRTCLLTTWRIDRPGASFQADWEGPHEELLPLLQSKSGFD
ncbi:MAG: HAD hydrolase-like protein, partial [Desulfuromonadales bacterium]|nr:HAD hydrolase-like protein [Desulfuromonadales bacterium]